MTKPGTSGKLNTLTATTNLNSNLYASERHSFNIESLILQAGGERCILGELLVQAKRITRIDLDVCLKIQQHTGEKLGYILKRQGYITTAELNALLAFQSQQGSLDEKSGPLQLGNLLLANNEITQQQLEEALHIQKTQNKKLGHILIEQGFIKPASVKRNLDIQNRLLSLALGTLITAVSVLTSNSAIAANMKVAYVTPVNYEQNISTVPSEAYMAYLYRESLQYLNAAEDTSLQLKAEKTLEFLANNGYIKAQFTLGMIYIDSIYTEDQGLYWLQQAANSGNEDAQFAVDNYQERDFGIGC
ncbi:MAG: hypothetical protein OEX03_02950 [Gammaproteobacteria bacterium]|nr:hypothetical protein [Gammaproteobacteria bacterium]